MEWTFIFLNCSIDWVKRGFELYILFQKLCSKHLSTFKIRIHAWKNNIVLFYLSVPQVLEDNKRISLMFTSTSFVSMLHNMINENFITAWFWFFIKKKKPKHQQFVLKFDSVNGIKGGTLNSLCCCISHELILLDILIIPFTVNVIRFVKNLHSAWYFS